MTDIIQRFDDNILLYILQHLHTPLGDKFMIFITTLGNSGLIWIAIAIVLLLSKQTRKYGTLLTFALLLEFLLGDGILKPLIGRARPFYRFPDVKLLINPPHSFSFPSGHTMSSFTAATIIFYSNKKAGFFAYGLASLIAFSRLYLFFHYPTDIVGGIILGTITALTVIIVSKPMWIKVKSDSPFI